MSGPFFCPFPALFARTRILNLRIYYIAKQHRDASEEGSAVLPIFLAQKAIKPFIPNTLGPLQFAPISYRSMNGGASKGIPAIKAVARQNDTVE